MEKNPFFYRTNDHIENFKLKLVLRELSRVSGRGNEGRTGDALDLAQIISWQEKLYSPGDIANYLKHREANAQDEAEQDTRRQLHRLDESGTNVEKLLKDVMVYTYTDKDSDFPRTAPPITFEDIVNDQESYLSHAMTADAHVHTLGARERKVRERIFREKPYKTMHICLATDVDVDALIDGKFVDASLLYTEHILFSIRIYTDGLIEAAPQFSRQVEEDDGITIGETSSSLFMNDESVANAVTKGVRLHSYKVRSEFGSEFEYALLNINDVRHPVQIQELRKGGTEGGATAASASGGRIADPSQWKQDPPSAGYEKSMAYFAEIVSAKGFDGTKLFVDYEVVVPQGWNLRTGNLSDGIGEEDLIAVADQLKNSASEEDRKVAEAARAKIDLDGYDDGDDAKGMLHGITHTASVFSRRGGIRLPQIRPNWKGYNVPYAFDPTSRFIWGISFFIITCFSVIIGINYPFWIVPGLVLLFTIGLGHPGGPMQVVINPKGAQVEDVNKYDSTVKKAAEGSGFHKTGMRKQLVGDDVIESEANFNHMINLSFDARDRDISVPVAIGGAQVPTILFTVYSVGWFDRVYLEGYTFVHLPTNSGTVDMNIKAWKPVGSIVQDMNSYFLGQAPFLNDRGYVDIPDKFDNPSEINRFGVLSENAGEIRFRCNISVTDPRHGAKFVEETNKVDLVAKGVNVRRSVDEILKSYRQSYNLTESLTNEARASSGLGSSRGMRGYASSLRSSGGLRESLNAGPGAKDIDATNLKSRTDDLLAKIRAKTTAASTLADADAKADRPSTVGVSVSRSIEMKSLSGGESKSFKTSRDDINSGGSTARETTDATPLLAEEKESGALGDTLTRGMGSANTTVLTDDLSANRASIRYQKQTDDADEPLLKTAELAAGAIDDIEEL